MQVGYAEIAILGQYLTSLRAANRSSGKCNALSCDGPWRVYNTSRWLAAEFVDGGKQQTKCIWQEASTLRQRQRYAVANLKPISNNNRRLRTSHYFVEANHWRTQSIARPLCTLLVSTSECHIAINAIPGVIRQEVKVIWQKAPHGGPIPRLGVIPGGRNLYHWILGVGVPISVP